MQFVMGHFFSWYTLQINNCSSSNAIHHPYKTNNLIQPTGNQAGALIFSRGPAADHGVMWKCAKAIPAFQVNTNVFLAFLTLSSKRLNLKCFQ